MTDFDMRSWALKGAEQRLLEMADEASAIYAAFPELRENDGPNGRTAGRERLGRRGGEQTATKRRRKRRNFSAAQRKEISRRMKRYWATRRKQG